jgi:Short C-terminal domain
MTTQDTAIIIIGFLVVCGIVIWLVRAYGNLEKAEYDYICAYCGSLRKMSWPPRLLNSRDVCLACSRSQLVPADTPRGKELMEIYHGSVSPEERVRTTHEAAKHLVERLEGAVPPSEIADELEKLARLIQGGALTADEWQRAKAAILGKPKDRQADVIERLSKLHRAYQNGALSQSEFNMTKWDILSRVG